MLSMCKYDRCNGIARKCRVRRSASDKMALGYEHASDGRSHPQPRKVVTLISSAVPSAWSGYGMYWVGMGWDGYVMITARSRISSRDVARPKFPKESTLLAFCTHQPRDQTCFFHILILILKSMYSSTHCNSVLRNYRRLVSTIGQSTHRVRDSNDKMIPSFYSRSLPSERA